jgi:dTDP-4-dehydrorhamnose reductase
MVDYLTREAAGNNGVIKASRNWIPSCAHLTDTAEALWSLMKRAEPGLYHLEGNRAGLSFFDIASSLARVGARNWRVTPTDAPSRDNRMRDDRVPIGQLVARFTAG